ncbi:transcription factor bHLH122-like, partial [Carica papaya]|uniref:transcription factor bHLH122-like n=1 Tax=Carica papaya TaxID=3649 RepID=UPI000B8C729A
MSLLYSSSFKYPEGELRKNQDFMETYHHYQHQNDQHNSGLLRYRSAPSSFLENLVNGNNTGFAGAGANGNLNSEDYRYVRSSSPEMESVFEKYMTPCNGSGGSASHDLQEFGGKALKLQEAHSISQPNEYASGAQMIYQSLPVHNLANDNTTMDGSFGVINSMGSNSSMQPKIGTTNESNLVRQNSSPAGFLSNLGVENGFTVMRDFGNFRACNTTNGEATPSTGRLNDHMSLASGSRFIMPQIGEIENESMGASSPEHRSSIIVNGSDRLYMSNFANDSWNGASFSTSKRTS